ncbi:uncharacterized protein Z520_11457 [Fonsecaea multimorphosa CBS 102226]|uniref:REJ domain-containing protein n=1 Tax=Fonsecaea multimorphosa CBS 102226 TaxID=1442371 RepID=A0A0D2JQP0_9EURO|nr:uncharacterized protein Z520_11457 [Fonsecaea multimorphosa CBS 102226]KIX92794.1 hypothetical protein Z520_11457 [Fonsecaea multimorphosa CBS 102226]OAL18042.1 hypothetical protein AYO22_11058 [Fonsecaea multimorphosa]
MRPSQTEPFASLRGERGEHRTPWTTESYPGPQVNASIRGIRSEDSWVEISSRASSASLSSTNNDIITTGLQLQSQDERLSRQLQTSPHADHPQPRSTSAAGSSQDEYEESESESDRVLSSSNEDVYQGDVTEDDDTSTALGVGSLDKIFTPQPNAFSHPPSSTARTAPDSYFPPNAAAASEPGADRTLTQRSYQRQMQSRNRPASSSSYQPDHDAALRASLTTLLSCAAAVRPKGPDARPPQQRASTHPTTLRLVPESELESPPRQRRTSSPNKQTKRKSRESSKDRHAAKKVRAASAKATATANATGEELISPTLASWMISAGVVLVFSAISFSAGYAWGREVGRIEGEMGLPGGSCAQESMRSSGNGLRRLRWSSAASSIRA